MQPRYLQREAHALIPRTTLQTTQARKRVGIAVNRRVHVPACTLILRNTRGEHAAAAHLCPQSAVHTSI